MRWIDITLPEPMICQDLDGRLAAARDLAAQIPALQQEFGLDSLRVLEMMATAGQELFQGVVAVDPEAFSPTRATPADNRAVLGDPDHDNLVGYHLETPESWINLPWTWLHNGVGFLFEKHPICAGTCGSALPEGSRSRPWMQRRTRARFLVGENGDTNLKEILGQLRPGGGGRPEILFVPGHSDRERRRLIYREAELMEGALENGCQGETLVHLDLPLDPVTPSDLIQKSQQYQVIHFAGPTSHPAQADDPYGEFWMNRLIEETVQQECRELEDALGIEGEVLGVDPVTSLLDDIVERYETGSSNWDTVTVSAAAEAEAGGPAFPGGPAVPRTTRSWLLDDGPVMPEDLERGGILPPLVFSNSYLALPELGHRFVKSGASAFIGPVAPLFSRPARIFAGHCYGALGRGWSTGAAVWKASRECRRQFGDTHPAWLSYGIQGYGKLALQYL